MSPNGIFCVQQHVGVSDGQYTRHNLHHTSHTEKDTQRADCLLLVFFSPSLKEFRPICYPIALIESTIQKFSQDQTKNQASLSANENERPAVYLKFRTKIRHQRTKFEEI